MTVGKAEVPVRIDMRGLPPDALTLYRKLRKAGLVRFDANMMIAGYLLGRGVTPRFSRPSAQP